MSAPRRRRPGAAGVLTLAFAVMVPVLVAFAGSAQAVGGDGTSPPAPLPPTAGVQPVSNPSLPSGSGGTKTGTVGTCAVYAGAGGFGVSCANGGGGSNQTIAQILAGDPVPQCWDQPLTAAELPLYATAGLDDYRYYWQTCLSGVDPQGNQTGPIQFTRTFTFARKNAPPCPGFAAPAPTGLPPLVCVQGLTDHQHSLVDMKEASQQIPNPTIVVSPIPGRARVDADVAFSLALPGGGDPTVVGPITETGSLGAVQLRAVLTGLTVEPLGRGGGDALPCPAPYTEQATAGDTPTSKPNLCWYSYRRSSARQPSLKFPVHATATWVVQINTGAGFVNFTDPFTKSQDSPLTVTEIQTIVVP